MNGFQDIRDNIRSKVTRDGEKLLTFLMRMADERNENWPDFLLRFDQEVLGGGNSFRYAEQRILRAEF